jgi:opacity protein-like surface antigen
MKNYHLLTLAVLVFTFTSLTAQDKWSVEIRPNLDFPTQDLGDAELNPGFGIEVAIGYRFMEHLGAYAGWGYNTFNADNSFAGTDTDFDETGYTFGFQFIHPIHNSSISYLLRAGGIYNHIEAENWEGDILADSGHGLGWEIGAGLQIDLGSQWNLRPQFGYRELSREIETGSFKGDVDLNYISFGVGIAKIF